MSLLNYLKTPEDFKSELMYQGIPYKDQAALILLDRLKTSEPIDLLPIVSALKEFWSNDENPDKRHWKPV